ncbi:MAG: glycosyltransferase family 2 protein [Planctomycetaceae bacterium]
MSLLAAIFWLSAAAVLYIYAGYPLLVWLAGRLRSSGAGQLHGTTPDDLSVVIVVCNEAHRLRAKLDSLLAADCADRIREVLIGSDGSDDDTTAVLASYPDPRVRLIHFNERRGKPAVLNEVIPHCQSELVILTDARQPLEPDAISMLAARFADPRVGVVSGELMFRTSHEATATAIGMGAYWSYEKFIRKSESRFRSVPGATGAFYAIRKSLFRRVPDNTLLDDVVIPMQAIEQGYRCLLESGAIAWDTPSQSNRQEAIRKRRTIAGAAQLLVNQPRWLLPWKNPIWWEFVSHKLLRLISPLLLLLTLGSNLALVASPSSGPLARLTTLPYQGTLALQCGFYLLALLAWLLTRAGRKAAILSPVLMFVSLNITTLLALWDATRGRYRATWQRAA